MTMRVPDGQIRRPISPPPARPHRPLLGAPSFADRVMAAVADEPRPTPSRVFLSALLRLSFAEAFAALLAAWRLAFQPTSSASGPLRARSFALLLSVFIIVGVGGPLAASRGLGLLDSSQDPAPGPAAPSLLDTEPSPLVMAAPSAEPTPELPASKQADDGTKASKPKTQPKKTPAAPVTKRKPAPTKRPATEEKEDREDREDREDAKDD